MRKAGSHVGGADDRTKRRKPERTRAYVYPWALCPVRRALLQEEADRYTNGNRSALLDLRVFGLRNPKAQSRPSPADDRSASVDRVMRMLTMVHLQLTGLERKGVVPNAVAVAIRLELAQAISLCLPNGPWILPYAPSDPTVNTQHT